MYIYIYIYIFIYSYISWRARGVPTLGWVKNFRVISSRKVLKLEDGIRGLEKMYNLNCKIF